MQHLPRILFASPSSGSGKTVVTCGVLAALAKRGARPAAFKCGPDFIDPLFHRQILGIPSKNLDLFFTDAPLTRRLFAQTAKNAGISVMEGVMGLYDGLGTTAEASSYDLARVTETPVILIVDARGMGLSLLPLIQGFLSYQRRCGPDLIRGVILNRTSRASYDRMQEKIMTQTGVRLYGYVPDLPEARIDSRHLGLATPDTIPDLKARMDRLGAELERTLDLDGILALAEEAPDYRDGETASSACLLKCRRRVEESGAGPAPRIAVAKDEAFCFSYADNLGLLSQLGAELAFFSPLRDEALPEGTQGLLFGGGYPELYAQPLSENRSMRSSVKEAVEEGVPYLAECGGFLYLLKTLEDMDGTVWPMCGVLSAKGFRKGRSERFGYVNLQRKETGAQTGFLERKKTIRGHEFHYYESTDPGDAWIAEKPDGKRSWECMHVSGHSAAGFPHLYYWSDPEFAVRFLKTAKACRRGKG